MYRIWEVESQSGLYHIRIDGPQSIFQNRVDMECKLALFLPTLVLFPGKWYATTTVLWGKKRKMKRLFCLSNKAILSVIIRQLVFGEHRQRKSLSCVFKIGWRRSIKNGV